MAVVHAPRLVLKPPLNMKAATGLDHRTPFCGLTMATGDTIAWDYARTVITCPTCESLLDG